MIFKIYLKVLKQVKNILCFQTYFCFTKNRERFFKTICKNYFLEFIFKKATKQILSIEKNFKCSPLYLQIFLRMFKIIHLNIF